MNNQAAINEALDKLEIDNGVIDEEIIEDVVDEVHDVDNIEEVEEVEEVEEQPKQNPPGYIDNIEDWVAAGKDPDLFKGKKAYSAEYERIKEIKELKETMQTVVEGVGEWKEQQKQTMTQQLEQARAEAVAELERAKDDVDVDAAIEAQKKINELDKPKQQPETYQPNPAIADFYAKNPMLDKNSAQYDSDVFEDTAGFHDTLLNELTGGKPEVINSLNPSQRVRILNAALSKAKELNPNKFVSPRNQRKAAPAPSRKKVQQKGGDYQSRLKSVKSNSKNKRDTNAANEIYEMLKAKDPKAAETFAKNVLGE
jgi:uncharacterized protein YbjQ (UPF0145 family)